MRGDLDNISDCYCEKQARVFASRKVVTGVSRQDPPSSR